MIKLLSVELDHKKDKKKCITMGKELKNMYIVNYFERKTERENYTNQHTDGMC